MASTSDIEYSHVLDQRATSSAHLRVKEAGDVELYVKHTSADPSVSKTTLITTTVTACSWNVYATAKLPRLTQVSNRAQLVDTTSNGQTIRIGNAIFLPQPGSSSASVKPFIPSKFSLYIDSVEQHGQRLFVTSRQDITTIPEPQDEPAKDADTKPEDDKSKDDKLKNEEPDAETVKTSTESDVTFSATPADAATKDKEEEKIEEESSDDDDPSDKIPEPESEDSSNELSACESWSEGSTEYDSDQQIAEFRPIMPPRERLQSASDSDSSSEPEEESEASAPEDSDNGNNLVEGEDKDGQGRYMDSDEESERWEAMFVTDRVDPATDVDDQNSEAGYQDDDFPDWNDWSDGDGFKAAGSDSEECSECGEDGGACALPPKDDILPPSTADKDAEEPIGCPIAQIHIYDLSRKTATTTDTTDTTDSNSEPTRIFHFKRATEQTLANSPLAVHPTKPLLVWPLGDNKILFADYLSNTYFVRKFQTSQFWSVHVSINCHFSDDGNYLHVVAVEKSGKPPALPDRVKKGKEKADSKKNKEKDVQKPKDEKPKYSLIVSTYRMSQSKTTKVPPVLIGRVQKSLGELDILPTVSWVGANVYISLSKRSTCHIYRVDAGCPSAGKSKRSKQGKMTMKSFTAGLPEWAVGRDLRFLPSDGRTGEGRLIVAAETTKIPPYKPVTQKESDKTLISETETSKDSSAVDETPSTASTKTTAEPEMNGAITDGDGTETDIPHIDGAKMSESQSQSPYRPYIQNGSEQVNNLTDTNIDITPRPETCPISSCDYHTKEFTRKYDKDRHTLTHYRGTMVCVFCPNSESESAAEKSFDRVDVFKRHLTTVHGVERTPLNSGEGSSSKSNIKLSSDCQNTTGKCSICATIFANAQEFYEHLDDCVLKVVVQQKDQAAETVEGSASTSDGVASTATDPLSDFTQSASQSTDTNTGNNTDTPSSSAPASTSIPTESNPEPEPKPTPNPHTNTMTVHLSSKLIKSLGGWRDTSYVVDEEATGIVNCEEECCGVGARKCTGSDEKVDEVVNVKTLEFESA